MNYEWIFLILALGVGMVGMIGIKRRSRGCIVTASFAMPVLIFAALWCGIPMQTMAIYFGVITLCVLLGLPGGGER